MAGRSHRGPVRRWGHLGTLCPTECLHEFYAELCGAQRHRGLRVVPFILSFGSAAPLPASFVSLAGCATSQDIWHARVDCGRVDALVRTTCVVSPRWFDRVATTPALWDHDIMSCRLEGLPNRTSSRTGHLAVLTVTSLVSCYSGEVSSETSLHHAVAGSPIPELWRMAKQHPRAVHMRDAEGATPLHLAAAAGNAGAVRALVKAGANMNVQDSKGRTPLHHAVAVMGGYSLNHLASVDALVELGAPITRRYTDAHGRTPLHVAAVTGNVRAVVALAKPWFDLDAQDASGITAAHLASELGLDKAVQALGEAGAKLDLFDNAGDTPEDLAARRHHTSVVGVLRRVRQSARTPPR